MSPSLPAAGGWTREELESLPRTLLSRDSRLKPGVWLVKHPDGDGVVKDTARLTRSRRRLGRWLLNRERRALERLDGIDGIPRVLARIDRDAFVCARVPGKPLDAEAFRRAPRELVTALHHLMDRIHDRGVYHLDLHQRQNILVDDDGRPHLVDFGAALMPGPIARALFGRLLGWVDRQSTLKYLARFAPECLEPDEARAVLRRHRLRKLWIFTRHPSTRERTAARERLRP